ncbi:MAG: hypothetical protein KJ645_09920, partial [Planctomycetes bacterium]|nr:hypothetical protein [Planctomycetota bacterium]
MQPFAGVQSLKLSTIKDNDSTSDAVRLCSPAIPITGGTTYFLSAYVKTNSGIMDRSWDQSQWNNIPEDKLNLGLDITWLKKGSPIKVEETIRIFHTTHSWKQLTGEVVAPTTADGASISCKLFGHLPNADAYDEMVFWIDEVWFYEKPESVEPQPIPGELTRVPNGLHYEGRLEGLHPLSLKADIVAETSCIKIAGTLADSTGDERAMDLAFKMPMDLVGWTWWDDMNSGRPMDPGGQYSYTVTADETGNLPMNQYFISCFSNSQTGLAWGVPTDCPRIFRCEYDAEAMELRIIFSLGLSPATVKFPSKATFEIVMFQYAPEWGFRAAWDKYTHLFPDAFALRTRNEEPMRTPGIIPPRNRIDWITTPEDFGMRYMHATNLEKPSSANMIYNLSQTYGYGVWYYILPWADSCYATSASSPPPDYPSVFSYQQDDWSLSGMAGDVAEAMAHSFITDTSGDTMVTDIEVYNHNQGQWTVKFPVNGDDELPNGAGACFLDYIATVCEIADDLNGNFSAIFMDNFFDESSFLDSSVQHFAYTDIPLTYSPNTFKPALHLAFTHVEFLRAVSGYLAAHRPETVLGPNVIAEGPAMFGFPFIAAFPFEFGKIGFNGGRVDWDYRRAMAGPRPCIAYECRGDILNKSMAEIEALFDEDMHRCLAYGFYPGLSKMLEICTEAQFSALTDLFKPKFENMIPIIDQLASAEWQPVTYGAEIASGQAFVLERFGRKRGQPAYFTLYNSSDSVQSFTLEI